MSRETNTIHHTEFKVRRHGVPSFPTGVLTDTLPPYQGLTQDPLTYAQLICSIRIPLLPFMSLVTQRNSSLHHPSLILSIH